MAALLTSVLENTSKVAEYIADCKENGIKLLPPDINESDDSFTVSGNDIRFGLVAVKNIGRGFIREVMSERKSNGRFTSFDEFCRRMYGRDLNRRAVESLIKCGAFDSTGAKRRQLMEVCGSVLDGVSAEGRKNIAGQMDLFGNAGEADEEKYRMILPNVQEYSPIELMTMEKETTGLYLSGHPMDSYKTLAERAGAVSIGSITGSFEEKDGRFNDGDRVNVAGVISAYKTKTTRNQSLMAYIDLEDYTGAMELMAFQRVIETSGGYIKENSPVFVTGRISARDEKVPQIVCDTIRPLDESILSATEQPKSDSSDNKKIYVKMLSTDTEKLDKLKLVLEMFVGTSQLIIYFADTKKRLGGACLIHPSLIAELKEMFGDNNVVVA